MSPVAARTLDFTNVKENSGINPKHIESGEYLAKIVSVEELDAKDGTPMWLFVITPNDMRSAAYPYYCKLQDNQLWKVRNLFISAGLGNLVAGAKKAKINPNKVIGKQIGILLEDDEYEGKLKSVIDAVMPASDLEDGGVPADPDVDDEDDDDEEEAPVVAKKKRKPAPVVEDDEDEEEEEEAPAPKKRRKAAPVVEEDEDDEEEEEAPKPRKKAKAKPVVEEDDEDEEDEEEEKPVSKRTAARRAAKAAAAKKAKKAPADDDDEEDDELDLDDL